MISCILLSAGDSSRFGSPKALALINGKPIIRHLQRILINSLVDEVIVVLGSQQEKIKLHILKHKKVKVVYNKDYKLGQTSSFKVGLSGISSKSSGILLLPVDCPLIKRETIDLLVNTYFEEKPDILIPTYNNKKGHPPIFDVKLKNDFLALDNNLGINNISNKNKDKIKYINAKDIGVVLTFNTKEEFKNILNKVNG